MVNGLCHSTNWSSLGNLGGWGWVGLILNMVLWLGVLAGLALLVVLAIRRGRVQAATVAHAAEQPGAQETLRAQYARGEITREQYEPRSK